jgi:predicted O-methyltransferase YrrM
LWNGAVVDESNQTDDTRAIREFNRLVHADERVDISLLPVGDGLTLALKR